MQHVIRNGVYVIVDTIKPGDLEVPVAPDKYSSWHETEWVFDKEKWLDMDIRPERDARLQETDIYMFLDRWNQLTEEQQTALLKYRQDLRDVPETMSYENITWPIKPIFIK